MRTAGVALAACCWWAACAPGAAGAETGATLRLSLLPNRLGAATALTVSSRFSGGEEGVPPPLRRMVVHLPAGLTVNLQGVRTCARSRLQRKGPAGCPAASRVGRGHSVLEVHAGSLTIPEEAAVNAFRGPDRNGRHTLQIYGQGETPLDQATISTGVLEPDSGPYGLKVAVTIPPIPTLAFEPDASIASLSLTVGGPRRPPRAHAAASTIIVPRRCPSGGFPFAANFTFADGSTASASAKVPCP